VYFLNYIDKPDLKGTDCTFVQHGLEVPNWFVLATPVHPNYRLGALEGSPCDTLTIGTSGGATQSGVLRLYPNPAQDEVALELPAEWVRAGDLQYQLLTPTGAVALEGRLSPGVATAVLPLAGLSDGLYVCQVLRNGRVLGTVKLSVVKN
jgi:hypothetical protein